MLEQACSPVSPGDATRKEEIHRLTRVTARGLRLPLQASNIRRRLGQALGKRIGCVLHAGALQQLDGTISYHVPQEMNAHINVT